MNNKHWLKPNLKKIIIFLLLIIPTSIIPNFGFGIWWSGADIGVNYGFPFNFYGYGGGPPLRPGQQVPTYGFDFRSFILLLGNIVIWYIVSCLIVWIYYKVKKK